VANNVDIVGLSSFVGRVGRERGGGEEDDVGGGGESSYSRAGGGRRHYHSAGTRDCRQVGSFGRRYGGTRVVCMGGMVCGGWNDLEDERLLDVQDWSVGASD
jgi:hypothetical protein